MRRKEAMDWLVGVCALVLRLSQAKTLSDLVEAACRTQRANLSEVGRRLAGDTAAKHRIKRVWRFTSNERVEPVEAMRPAIAHLLKKRTKPLLVALDWTDIGGFHVLMAAACIGTRAIPLLWSTHVDADLHKSRNALEEGLLLVLRSMIPKAIKVIILADRGFGRTELARFCQAHQLHYVIRIKPDVWVRHSGFTGNLKDYAVKKGMARRLNGAKFRKEEPLTQDVVVRWKTRLPKNRDEPWFLMTDLPGTAVQISELYARRMSVEELFRDEKNRRNGWSLRHNKITRADRVDRFLLVLALAYWLLAGVGLIAKQRFRPGMWCSSNDPKQCSVFIVGKEMWDKLNEPIAAVLAALVAATEAPVSNWG